MNRFAVVALIAIGSAGETALADSFGSGEYVFEIAFSSIGVPNNPPQVLPGGNGGAATPPRSGSVAYAYRIGTYEISESMIDAANALAGLGITKNTRGPDKPATGISWFEAARFTNWLNTSTGHAAAYNITSRVNPGDPLPVDPRWGGGGTGPDPNLSDFALWAPGDPGYDPNNPYRSSLAMYFLPSHDEWYKAAYFDPTRGVYHDYPTGSNTVPSQVAGGTAAGTAVYGTGLSGPSDIMSAGGASPFGTFAQGGNAEELLETEIDRFNDSLNAFRVRRGGSFGQDVTNLSARTTLSTFPSTESPFIGFRVASRVPEPSAMHLLMLGAACQILAGSLRPGPRTRRGHG